MLDGIRTKIAKAVYPNVGTLANVGTASASGKNPFHTYPKFDNTASKLVGQELGRSGLKRYFPGWIRDEYLPELQGRQKYLVFREMGDMNAYCAAALNAFAMFLRRAKWKVDPVNNENESNGAADFLEECMADMEHSWQSFIATVSRMVPQYGFCPFEIVYKRRDGLKDDYRYSSKFDDGKIGWQNFALRSPDTILHWVWYQDDPNRLQGLRQLTPPDFPPNLFIPIEKLLLLRAEPGQENPEGRSILRSSYKPFFTIRYLEDARNVIIEHSGTGIPLAEVPPNINEPYKFDPITGEPELDDDGNPVVDHDALRMRESIVETLTSLRVGEQPWLIVPLEYDEKGNKRFEIKFLTNNAGPMIADINTTVREEGMKILMSTMSEFLAMGTNQTGGGSFALSKDKTDNFSLAITAYLDAFEDSINNQAVPRLFQLNPEFEDLEEFPRIVHTDIVPMDMREVSMILGSFRGIGWDISEEEEIKNMVLDELGLPKAVSHKTVPLLGSQPNVGGIGGPGASSPTQGPGLAGMKQTPTQPKEGVPEPKEPEEAPETKEPKESTEPISDEEIIQRILGGGKS